MRAREVLEAGGADDWREETTRIAMPVLLRCALDRVADHGTIAFSQFYDTAEFVGQNLARQFPKQPVAIYAGGGRSFVLQGDERRRTDRNVIKGLVQSEEIKLVAATDAACEGLNLQRLGSQVNVDLPWNPSRLEPRKGRVQRIGQPRAEIHVAHLRYAGTYEDEVYGALSERFEDIFKVLGQLPDSFEDDCVDAILRDRSAISMFSSRVALTRPPVERRYWRDIADDTGLDWEGTEKILSSRDIEEFMRKVLVTMVHHARTDIWQDQGLADKLICELGYESRGPMTSTTTFGAYIARVRKEKGISQKDLAAMVLREDDGKPISPQYLNDIERDRRNPTSDHTIRQFATVLQADPDYLFYLAGTLPEDVRAANVAPEVVARAFKAFRKSTG